MSGHHGCCRPLRAALDAMYATVNCHCGQRIFSRDVVQHGLYVRQFGPPYVYVRFRCSRCKKLGEQFIRQEEWEDRLLLDQIEESPPEELRRFEEMGPISVDEMVDFHYALDQLGPISTGEPESKG